MIKLILLLTLVFSITCGVVFEESPDKVLLKHASKVELKVNGNKAEGKVFYSKSTNQEIFIYFKDVFIKDGFNIEYLNNSGINALSASFRKGNIKKTVQILTDKTMSSAVIYEIEEKTRSNNKGDKPGIDLDDVPRPVPSVREYCIERVSGKEKSVTVFYRTGNSKSSIVNYYKQIMPKNKWSGISKEEDQLIFSKPGKWCLIGFDEGYVSISYYY